MTSRGYTPSHLSRNRHICCPAVWSLEDIFYVLRTANTKKHSHIWILIMIIHGYWNRTGNDLRTLSKRVFDSHCARLRDLSAMASPLQSPPGLLGFPGPALCSTSLEWCPHSTAKLTTRWSVGFKKGAPMDVYGGLDVYGR